MNVRHYNAPLLKRIRQSAVVLVVLALTQIEQSNTEMRRSPPVTGIFLIRLLHSSVLYVICTSAI